MSALARSPVCGVGRVDVVGGVCGVGEAAGKNGMPRAPAPVEDTVASPACTVNFGQEEGPRRVGSGLHEVSMDFPGPERRRRSCVGPASGARNLQSDPS